MLTFPWSEQAKDMGIGTAGSSSMLVNLFHSAVDW
mgnify:CR=1 FL=1